MGRRRRHRRRETGEHLAPRIAADCQKNGFADLLPIVPPFELFLLETPEDRRHGFVFRPKPQRIVFEPPDVAHRF